MLPKREFSTAFGSPSTRKRICTESARMGDPSPLDLKPGVTDASGDGYCEGYWLTSFDIEYLLSMFLEHQEFRSPVSWDYVVRWCRGTPLQAAPSPGAVIINTDANDGRHWCKGIFTSKFVTLQLISSLTQFVHNLYL